MYSMALAILAFVVSGAFLFLKFSIPVQHDDMTTLQRLNRIEVLVQKIAYQTMVEQLTADGSAYQKENSRMLDLITTLESEHRQLQMLPAPSGWKKMFIGNGNQSPSVLPRLNDYLAEFLVKVKDFASFTFEEKELQLSLGSVIRREANGELFRLITRARVSYQNRTNNTHAQLLLFTNILWILVLAVILMLGLLVFRPMFKKMTMELHIMRTDGEVLKADNQKLKSRINEINDAYARLKALLDTTTDGHLAVLNDKTLIMNHPFIELAEVPDPVVQSENYDQLSRFLETFFVNGEEFLSRFNELNDNNHENGYFTLESKDGRQIECRTRPLIVEEPVGRLWNFRDITEYVNYNQGQKASQTAQTEPPVSPTSFASIYHDVKGRIVEADLNAMQLFGYTHDEMLRLNIRNLFDSASLKDVKERYKQLSRINRLSFESSFLRQNNRSFTAKVFANRLGLNNQQVVHLLIQVVDFNRNGSDVSHNGHEELQQRSLQGV